MRRWLLPAGLLALCSACEDGQVASKDAGRPRPDAQVAPLPQPVDGGLLVFVAPDRSTDGDGSRARPLGSLVRAYEAVAAGDSVVLLAGDHGEVPAPPRGVRLVGEGTHATHVRGPLILDAAQTLEALTFHGALTLAGDAALVGVALQDSAAPIARVTGPSQWTEVRVTQITGPEAAVRVEAGGVLTWRGGGLHDLAGGAIHGEDAQLRLAGLDLSRFAGVGVALDDGTLEVDDLRMHAPVGAGVLITGGRATLSRVDVFDPVTDPVLNTASGFGVTGGEVTVSRSYVRGGDRAFRVAVQGRLQVVDCVADAPGADGLGVSVGAQGQATGLRVIRPRNAGLAVAGEGAVLGVADSVVERPGRIGLLVADGAHATTDGLTVTDAANRGVAVLAAGALLSGLVVERAGDMGEQITDATAEVRVRDSTL
ncbi:MAG: hypothetical protein KC613_09530, partial [Myxococcales bacterium]|nr:hypothetical protein [Myxococcales bacterium]